jgi:DNA polymerase-4
LIQGSYQFELFDDTAEKVLLYDKMDMLRNRFGEDIIQRASGIENKKKRILNPFTGKLD